MIAQVTIDENGGVTVFVDSGDPADRETARLAGLTLDDMLARASGTAVDTWLAFNAEDDE